MEQCNRRVRGPPSRARDRRCCSIVCMNSSAARGILLPIAFALTLATTIHGAAGSDFQAGEVLSITSDRGLDGVATHRWAVFTVQIGGIIYTASGKRIKHSSDDYSEGLSAGDSVRAAISGNEMILRKPHGGELKTKIIKRARAE